LKKYILDENSVHTFCYEATDNFLYQYIWLSASGCLVMPGNAYLQLGESYTGLRPVNTLSTAKAFLTLINFQTWDSFSSLLEVCSRFLNAFMFQTLNKLSCRSTLVSILVPSGSNFG